MLDFKIDEDKMEISVGEWVSNGIYYNYPKTESDLNIKLKILEKNGISLPPIQELITRKQGLKTVHKLISEHLGFKFNARLRAKHFDLWIKPKQKLLDEFCFYSMGFRHWYSPSQIKRLWKHSKLVDQALKDGQQNIIPLIIFFGCSPRKLKSALGKGLWKRLTRASKYRNKILVRMLMETTKSDRRIGTERNFEKHIAILRWSTGIKTTLLASHLTEYPGRYEDNPDQLKEYFDQLNWVSNWGKVSNPNDIRHKSMLYYDTRMMLHRLGREHEFNTNWSLKKLTEKHDHLAGEITAIDYPSTVFPWLTDVNAEFQIKDVKVRLLNSAHAIAEEGSQMRHCVASYIYEVSEQDYLVFSLRVDEHRSTLGLWRVDGGGFELDQHYGYANMEVFHPQLKEAAEFMSRSLRNSGGFDALKQNRPQKAA